MKLFSTGKLYSALIFVIALLMFTGNGHFILSSSNNNTSQASVKAPSSVSPVSKEMDTRGMETVILSENFNSDWGVFEHGAWGGGYIERTNQVDANSRAYSGNSVFMSGDDDREWEQCFIYTWIDLRNTSDVELEFRYAYEDMEGNERLLIDIDVDGNPGNGYSNPQWKRVPANENNNYDTEPANYQLIKYDLSQLPKNSNVYLRFRAIFTTSTNAGLFYDLICIDNVKIKANYIPSFIPETIEIAPTILYPFTGDTSLIKLSLWDRDNHSADNFSVTVDVRLSDDRSILRYTDNITRDNQKISLEKIADRLYNLTVFFSPNIDFGFGLIDLKIMIFDPEGLMDDIGYGFMDNAVELKDHFPVINMTSIRTDRIRANILGDSTIIFQGTFSDLDVQEVSDYTLTMELRDEDNITFPLIKDGINGKPGLSVEKGSNDTYDFSYLWEVPNDLDVAFYDLFLEIRDGYGGSDLSTFDINADMVELFKAEIHSPTVVPEYYNRHGGDPLFFNFTVNQNITSDYDLRNADMDIRLRSENGTIQTIYQASKKRGNLEFIDLTNNNFRVSYQFDQGANLANGSYDLGFSIFDNGVKICDMDFNENPDFFSVYYNRAPQIHWLSVFPVRLNTYYEPKVKIQISFSDPDLPQPALFDFSVSMKDPSENRIMVYSSHTWNSGDIEISQSDADKYLANITFTVNDTFQTGKYGVEAKVLDEFGISSETLFSDNLDVFELYYNQPPTPPHTLLPDTTRDTSPLLHWYGGHDREIESYLLEYYVRIGSEEGYSDILPWQSLGKNQFYQIENPLPYDTYFVEVIATDGLDNSSSLVQTLDIFVLANLPPTPPSKILPDFSIETLPLITWSGAVDGDGDTIRNNYIQIGTHPYYNDTLSWFNVDTADYYQVEKNLPFGTYYVQVRVSDGHSLSYVHQELVHIIGEGNAPPSPPTEMFPIRTWETKPNITWVGAYDINNDTLTFSLRIGTSSDQGDVIPWTENLTDSYYNVQKKLDIGKYYVQIKAYDGEFFSIVFEEIMEITEIGNKPPSLVTNITPSTTTNRTPVIRWEPAMDPDGDESNIVYFIQIGLSKGHGEVLSWYPVQNFSRYKLSKELAPNVLYYIQVKAFDGEGYSPVAYQTLGIIVYITEISFDVARINQTVEKGMSYTFSLRVMNRGTNPDNITITLTNDASMDPYITLSKSSIILLSEEEYIIILKILVAEKSEILGVFHITAATTSEFSDHSSVTGQPLSIRVVEKKGTALTFWAKNRLSFFMGLIVILLLLVLLIIIFVIKRVKNRIPAELLERESGSDSTEVTFLPDIIGGVVAKRIMPEARELFEEKEEIMKLPSGHKAPHKNLPEQKKRLALPQYSVVIDMHSRQVVGQTETKEAEMEKDEGEIIDFLFVDGKYEIQTTSVPSAHPYQKPTPTPQVPGEHLYKAAPTPLKDVPAPSSQGYSSAQPQAPTAPTQVAPSSAPPPGPLPSPGVTTPSTQPAASPTPQSPGPPPSI
ncbi:MAG: fibronectin type III domain-containing protein [Candidatus Thermoplasmatota archaeon]|nr:fibronectin type III domain-containing protein [Candidatus Thermoplasmatota archaeon]